jgi:hypothetical protein
MNNNRNQVQKQGQNWTVQIIIRNVPSKNVPKVIPVVVSNIKDHNPGAKITVIAGPKDKMAKLHHDKTNQQKIASKTHGGRK